MSHALTTSTLERTGVPAFDPNRGIWVIILGGECVRPATDTEIERHRLGLATYRHRREEHDGGTALHE